MIDITVQITDIQVAWGVHVLDNIFCQPWGVEEIVAMYHYLMAVPDV